MIIALLALIGVDLIVIVVLLAACSAANGGSRDNPVPSKARSALSTVRCPDWT